MKGNPICECSTKGCDRRIDISWDEYNAVTRDDVYIQHPDCPLGKNDKIVSQGPKYRLVTELEEKPCPDTK